MMCVSSKSCMTLVIKRVPGYKANSSDRFAQYVAIAARFVFHLAMSGNIW